MKTTSILFVSLAVIYASAQEAVVPEDSPLALEDDLSEARETLASMQTSGKSVDVCRKLVQDTKTEITTNVNTEQKILDGLSKGHECGFLINEADDEKVEQKRTEDKQKKAKEHKDKMWKATVNFGSRSFSSVKNGDCSWIFSHSSYTTAKANYNAAVKAHQESEGAAAKAVEETVKAVVLAKKATKECNCKTQLAHAVANKNSKRNDAANKKAWEMAHKLECVLDKKTTCRVPACPTTNPPALSAEVAVESCDAKVVTGGPVAMPTDLCAKWREEHKANQEIANALKAEVGFAANKKTISDQGKKTLDKVAKILNKYPWMTVNVQGHSSTTGNWCIELVDGRAENTKKYLKEKGCMNKMTVVGGTCETKKAITIGGQDSVKNAGGAGTPPKGCKHDSEHELRREK